MRRALAVLTGALALVVLAAAPAGAHAVLESTDPIEGAALDAAPERVTLQFTEPVELSLGAVRLYDSGGDRLDTGAAGHAEGDQSRVEVDVPAVGAGSYVVTWQVLSADGHPIDGAFTFTVGDVAAAGNVDDLVARLLAEQGGDRVVGTIMAWARVMVFGSLALLLGGAAFLVVVWPAGRGTPPARRVVWVGWFGAVVGTAAGLVLQGPYTAGLGVADVADVDLLRDVLDTRFGHVAVARLALLLAALVLLRVLLPGARRPPSEYPLPRWWVPVAGVVGLALAATPGLGGHAGSGDLVPLALAVDTIHVAAMAVWLGGLVVLLVAVLPRGDDVATLRDVVPRYSQVALGSVAVIVASGAFASWRQVGSIDALLDTDYGRLLLVKVLVVVVLLALAVASRGVVNRTLRRPPRADPPPVRELEPELVGARGQVLYTPGRPAPDAGPDDTAAEVRRLRRSVAAEVGVAVVILMITALLVNTPPARDEVAGGPFAETIDGDGLSFETLVTPGERGPNEVHLTAFEPGGATADVLELTATMSLPERDIAPIDVPLLRLGPGHYVSSGEIQLPIAGDWRLEVKALRSETDQVSAEATVPIG